MSWFQSGNLASFAKNAFKEAQKTIDKALDIKDETPTGSIVAGSGTDFFASWGVAVSSKYGDDPETDSNTAEDFPVSSSLVTTANDDGSLRNNVKFLEQHEPTLTAEPLNLHSIENSKSPDSIGDMENNVTPVNVSNTDVKKSKLELNEFTIEATVGQFQSLWFSEDGDDRQVDSEQTFNEKSDEDQRNLLEYSPVFRSPQSQSLVKPTPLSTQGESLGVGLPLQITHCSNSSTNLKSSKVGHLESIENNTSDLKEENPEQRQKISDEDRSVVNDGVELLRKPEIGGPLIAVTEFHPLEESDLTVSSASQGEWGWPSSDFADSVISADASTLTNSSTSENSPLPITHLSTSEIEDKREIDEDYCKRDNSDGLCDILSENDERYKAEEELRKTYVSKEEEETFLEQSSGVTKSQSQSPQESVETSENEHEEADTSPKISSRATSSISVLSGASEKESPCPSSPALGGYGASSNSDSPSFEIISMHSSNNKRISNQNHKPSQEFFLSDNIAGENSQVESSLLSSCSSSIANVYSCNSNSATGHSSSSFERVDPLSIVPSNDNQVRQHKKASSSTSSSDIEVLPLDTVERKISGCSPKVNTPMFTVAETQTDFQDEKVERPVPVKVASQVAEIITEKDSEIKQLREEGEKLSKKQFELSNVIKRLRAKEKDNETASKNLRQELSNKNAEYDKLFKTYVVKEGIEQTQNENICKLTSKQRQLELLVEQLRSELEDSNANCMSMKNSLETSAVEILELKTIISSAHRDYAELDSLTREKSELLNRTESLVKEVDHLRNMVKTAQTNAAVRESELKTDVSQLTHKVHLLENQLADASSEVADATMPLSLEIEKLQHEMKSHSYLTEKRESALQIKVSELQSKLQGAAERETSLKGMQKSVNKTVAFMEHQIETLGEENKRLKSELENADSNLADLKKKLSSMSQLERRLVSMTAEIEHSRNENESIKNELKRERSMSESERRKSQSLQDQINRNQSYHVRNTSMDSTSTISNANNKSGENSPSSQSIASEVSYLDEVFDSNGHHNRSLTPKSFFDNFSSVNFIESLQSQLRLREGEAIQFQEQVAKNEKIRKTLNDEIANLTVQNQELLMRLESMTSLQARMEEVEKNYNAVLQMYGEKVEESEELRLDLQDVKEMYKLQIEQLLRK